VQVEGAAIPTSASLVGTNGSKQFVSAGQDKVNAVGYAAGGGTANAQTVTLTPAPASISAGFTVNWLPSNANSSTTPTLSVNSSSPATITKVGGAALAASDLTTTAIATAKWDGTDWELQNPQTTSSSGPTTNQNIRNVQVGFDGGGVALSGTLTRCSTVSYAGTITEATIIADLSGSATIDVRTVAYSSYTGPSSASTITASATPALSSAIKYQDTTLSGWTTSLAANTVVCFVLTSPSTVTWLSASIRVAAN
jgi:hypothetical protein